LSIFNNYYFFEECARKECVEQHISNVGTVCVCNATYCDTFPSLVKTKAGFASVYESNKAGARFEETEIKIESSHKTPNATKSQTVTIDPTQKYQTIYGFGGAFTDTTGFKT
jgi:glucosylceramidase